MPRFMTPLRWLIVIAYIVVSTASYFYWQEIGAFFDFFIGNSIRFMQAAGGVLIALLTLKLGIAFVAIFTALLIIFKVLVGVLIAALLPGTLKAIALPLVFDFLSYIHNKSQKLQRFVTWLLDWSKGQYANSKAWWKAQHMVDKVALASLAILTVPVLGLVFFYKRFILPYLITKLGENFVQKGVKVIWARLKHTPLINLMFYQVRKRFVVSKRMIRKQNRRLQKLRQTIAKNKVA